MYWSESVDGFQFPTIICKETFPIGGSGAIEHSRFECERDICAPRLQKDISVIIVANDFGEMRANAL